jgi:serine/threonine-protein kinase
MSSQLSEFAASGYEIVGEIGRGGMGRVYQAREIALDRTVALKVLDAALAGTGPIAGLLREARSAAALDHPHIIPIYSVGAAGVAGSTPYIAMKYVDGQSVQQLLRSRGRLGVGEAIELLEAAASALDEAHRKGTVHLDIKPANLLLDRRGWLYVTDFGLAQAHGATISLAGERYATPDYSAPEQVRGAPPNPANDIYALGVVAYELISGQLPFPAGTALEALGARLTAQPTPLRQHRPELPEPVEAAVLAALERDPHRRPATAGAFVAQLRRAYALSPVAAPPPARQAAAAPPAAGMATQPLPAPDRIPARQSYAIEPAEPAPPRPRPARSSRLALLAERHRAARWLPLLLVVALLAAVGVGVAQLRPAQPGVSDVAALLRSGDQALVSGQPARARAIYGQAAGRFPTSPLPSERMARLHLLDEHYQEAEQAARSALALLADDPPALALLAEALAGQHRYDAALEAAERARTLAPQAADGQRAFAIALADRALRRSSAAMLDQAAQAAARAAQLQAGQAEPSAAIDAARAVAAQGYVEQLRFQISDDPADAARAAKYLEQASGMQNGLAAFHTQRGLIYAQQAASRRRHGDQVGADAAADAANAELGVALGIDPASAPAHAGQGWLALGQGQYDAALAAFDQALAGDPSSDSAILGKARVLLQQPAPDPAAAIALLRDALRQRPDSRTATALGWALLADAFAQDRDGQGAGGYLIAEQQFRQALASDDGSVDALNGLGWALRARALSTGDASLYDAAEQALRRSLTTSTRQPDALFGLGWVAFGRGAFPQAAQLFEQAAELNPADPTPRYWQGLALEQQGLRADARSVLVQAQRLGSPFAAEALARLER